MAEKNDFTFSLNLRKFFHRFIMSTEFLFIFVSKISSDMTPTLAATPHRYKAVDR